MNPSFWRRAWSIPAADRLLAVEAALWLGVVWMGLQTLPFKTVRRLTDGLARTARRHSISDSARVGRAVDRVSRQMAKITCLTSAVAAMAMLRRHGCVPELRLGVRRSAAPERRLEGHAWVECGGRIVVGILDEIPEFGLLSHELRAAGARDGQGH